MSDPARERLGWELLNCDDGKWCIGDIDGNTIKAGKHGFRVLFDKPQAQRVCDALNGKKCQQCGELAKQYNDGRRETRQNMGQELKRVVAERDALEAKVAGLEEEIGKHWHDVIEGDYDRGVNEGLLLAIKEVRKAQQQQGGKG